MDVLHLYIYNECDVEIVVTVTYVPLGAQKERTDSTNVAPGRQALICTSNRNWAKNQAQTADGKHWSPLEIPLLTSEYTHVLAGVVTNPAHAPDRWPNVTTRQYVCSAGKTPK